MTEVPARKLAAAYSELTKAGYSEQATNRVLDLAAEEIGAAPDVKAWVAEFLGDANAAAAGGAYDPVQAGKDMAAETKKKAELSTLAFR